MTDNLEARAGFKKKQIEVDIDRWPGRMLVALRENLGYSQVHVGEALGVSEERIASYETEKTPMSSEAISKAANFFGVLPSAFFKKIDLVGNADNILDRISVDYEFEQLLNDLDVEQRRKLMNVACILFY